MIYDTDVLIWALRGYEKAISIIDADSSRQASIISQMELIQGARNKKELLNIAQFTASFQIIPLVPEMGFRARTYLELFSIGHSLELADALIAATAVDVQATLCTGNIRHFRMINDLDVKAFRPN